MGLKQLLKKLFTKKGSGSKKESPRGLDILEDDLSDPLHEDSSTEDSVLPQQRSKGKHREPIDGSIFDGLDTGGSKGSKGSKGGLFKNLFSKKKSKPTPQLEEEVMTPENAYKPGDMFYGLAGPRHVMMERALGGDITEHRERHEGDRTVAGTKQAIYLDTLNNQFLGTDQWRGNRNIDVMSLTSKQKEQYNSYQGELPNEDPQVKGFREFLENHKKYDPRQTPGADQDYTRIGRACKGGIEYTTKNGNDVHFVLDKFDPKYLLEDLRKPNEERGVTGKEMKYLYRNKKKKNIQNNVKFWKDGALTQAPWETDPEPWKQYDKYRKQKHKKK